LVGCKTNAKVLAQMSMCNIVSAELVSQR
jgi:hypothetical protein